MCNSKENPPTKESEFLMRMYDQMFVTINRVHNNVWEMIVALGGGLGVLQLYCECECGYIFDVAIIAYIITLTWILARLVDANYWCNRNLFIIHEIEKELLGDVTTKRIFKGFRDENRDIKNRYGATINLQIFFVALVILGTVLSYLCFRCPQFKSICVMIYGNYVYFAIVAIVLLPFLPAIIMFFVRKCNFEEKTK